MENSPKKNLEFHWELINSVHAGILVFKVGNLKNPKPYIYKTNEFPQNNSTCGTLSEGIT